MGFHGGMNYVRAQLDVDVGCMRTLALDASSMDSWKRGLARCPSGVDTSTGADLRQCCSRSGSVRSRPAPRPSFFLLVARSTCSREYVVHCGRACIGWIALCSNGIGRQSVPLLTDFVDG